MSAEQLPLEVKAINFQGAKITRADFLLREFSSVLSASTFGEVSSETLHAIKRLRELNIFSKAVGTLVPVPGDDDPAHVNLDVELVEKSRFYLSTEATHEISRSENQAAITGYLRNALGGGELASASVVYGTEKTRAFSVSLDEPRPFGSRARMRARVAREVSPPSMHASYSQLLRSASLTLASETGQHEAGYLGLWRELTPAMQPPLNGVTFAGPSPTVTAASEISYKSALTYVFKSDNLDHPTLPTDGTQLKLATELAGLGGDARFAKAEAWWKSYSPFNDNIAFGVSAYAGVCHPLGSDEGNEKIPLPDRLFLGGPLSVRGYQPLTIGPRDESDAVGANLSLAVAAEATFALPSRIINSLGARGHVYANAGNAVGVFSSHKNAASALLSDVRLSAGIGLVVPTPIGRLELNFSRAASASSSDDNDTKGFQIGLGFSWL